MDTSEEVKLATLWKECRVYIDKLKADWLLENRVNSRDVYEVMSNFERERVNGKIRAWEHHVTPRTEKWWEERGYRVEWPDDNSKPMKVSKL
jgi:hypothetical protein